MGDGIHVRATSPTTRVAARGRGSAALQWTNPSSSYRPVIELPNRAPSAPSQSQSQLHQPRASLASLAPLAPLDGAVDDEEVAGYLELELCSQQQQLQPMRHPPAVARPIVENHRQAQVRTESVQLQLRTQMGAGPQLSQARSQPRSQAPGLAPQSQSQTQTQMPTDALELLRRRDREVERLRAELRSAHERLDAAQQPQRQKASSAVVEERAARAERAANQLRGELAEARQVRRRLEGELAEYAAQLAQVRSGGGSIVPKNGISGSGARSGAGTGTGDGSGGGLNPAATALEVSSPASKRRRLGSTMTSPRGSVVSSPAQALLGALWQDRHGLLGLLDMEASLQAEGSLTSPRSSSSLSSASPHLLTVGDEPAPLDFPRLFARLRAVLQQVSHGVEPPERLLPLALDFLEQSHLCAAPAAALIGGLVDACVEARALLLGLPARALAAPQASIEESGVVVVRHGGDTPPDEPAAGAGASLMTRLAVSVRIYRADAAVLARVLMAVTSCLQSGAAAGVQLPACVSDRLTDELSGLLAMLSARTPPTPHVTSLCLAALCALMKLLRADAAGPYIARIAPAAARLLQYGADDALLRDHIDTWRGAVQLLTTVSQLAAVAPQRELGRPSEAVAVLTRTVYFLDRLLGAYGGDAVGPFAAELQGEARGPLLAELVALWGDGLELLAFWFQRRAVYLQSMSHTKTQLVSVLARVVRGDTGELALARRAQKCREMMQLLYDARQ